ncbi:MAG: TlpA disulfide reductase family protein [Lachnospiraceae bacterium]|nr:TlpA disulfide reductase family protein [Lachnospiraceae bacterium]
MSIAAAGCSKDTMPKETEAKNTEAEVTEAAETETQAGATGLFGAFETKTLEGEAVDQSIFAEADLNMVNIWGTFCGPCIREMPELGELAAEYEEKGMQLLGIISDVVEPGDETAMQIVEKTKADYTHLVLSQELWNNYLGSVQAVPTTIFVDKDGNQVGDIWVGSRSKEDWTKIIDEALEQVAP